MIRFLKQRAIPQAFLMAGGNGANTWKAYAQFLEWVLLDRFASPAPQREQAVEKQASGRKARRCRSV